MTIWKGFGEMKRKKLEVDLLAIFSRKLREGLGRATQLTPDQFIEMVIRDEQGYPLKQAKIHREMQKFISENDRGVIMIPREHGKTTQMEGRIAYIIANDPNSRHKIVCSSETLAIERCKVVRSIIESEEFRRLYPHIKPKRGEWGEKRFSVERSGFSPEPTCRGFGVHSKDTGGRADYLWLDDVDDAEVISSEAIRRRNYERVVNVWINLLTPSGRAYLFCTPWHRDDTSQRLSKVWAKLEFKIRDMKPIWKERWSKEALQKRKQDIGSLAFARGFELKLIDEETRIFREDMIRYANIDKVDEVIISVDLAISQKDTAHYTGIVVLGIDFQMRQITLLAVRQGRWNFPQAVQTLSALCSAHLHRWGVPPQLVIESNAYQKALPDYLKSKREFGYKVIPVYSIQDKFTRWSKLSLYLETMNITFSRSLEPCKTCKELVNQMLEAPVGEYDDLLDAFTQGVDYCVKRLQSRSKVITITGG